MTTETPMSLWDTIISPFKKRPETPETPEMTQKRKARIQQRYIEAWEYWHTLSSEETIKALKDAYMKKAPQQETKVILPYVNILVEISNASLYKNENDLGIIHIALAIENPVVLETLLEKIFSFLGDKNDPEVIDGLRALGLSPPTPSDPKTRSKRKDIGGKTFDLNVKDTRGYTPLHHAVMRKNTDTHIEILLKNGADPNIQSPQGYTPLDILSAFHSHCPNEKVFLNRMSLLEKHKAERNTDVDCRDFLMPCSPTFETTPAWYFLSDYADNLSEVSDSEDIASSSQNYFPPASEALKTFPSPFEDEEEDNNLSALTLPIPSEEERDDDYVDLGSQPGTGASTPFYERNENGSRFSFFTSNSAFSKNASEYDFSEEETDMSESRFSVRG